MISVLFCSRVKDNPASNLPGLLESMADCTTPQERSQVEFLIKFDDDDPYRVSDDQLKKYPFQIRSWVYSRGEGRHGLHHAQEYLFAQRDPRSRFCLMTADDFKFTRPGFVSEILGIQDEFVILGYRRPPIESYAGRYEEEAMIRQWVVSIGEWSPVISTRLIEVCQNFGWQSNVDSWLIALSVVLYDLYKIVLWRQHEPFYVREGGAGLGNTPTYNNMELTDKIGPCNRYWFELVRRQARNVFLNMEYGTDLKHVPSSAVPQRLWRKFRSQPLHRLPIRLCRRIGRDLGLLPT